MTAAPTSGRASAVIGSAVEVREADRKTARGLHGEHERRHAEQRSIERVWFLVLQMTLAERAGGRDEHRLVRSDQDQRREIQRVRTDIVDMFSVSGSVIFIAALIVDTARSVRNR